MEGVRLSKVRVSFGETLNLYAGEYESLRVSIDAEAEVDLPEGSQVTLKEVQQYLTRKAHRIYVRTLADRLLAFEQRRARGAGNWVQGELQKMLQDAGASSDEEKL